MSESAEQSEISMDDLNMVNEYIKKVGANEMMLASAEDLDHFLYENSKTQVIKTSWQLVMDFVRNEQSSEPQLLDYSIAFEDSSFEMIDNQN